MGVQANNPGGVQSVSLTGSGMAICNGNSSTAPYTQAHPFSFTIPPQSYTYPVQSNNQVLTQENVVYTFSWANGPTMPAYAACGGLRPARRKRDLHRLVQQLLRSDGSVSGEGDHVRRVARLYDAEFLMLQNLLSG